MRSVALPVSLLTVTVLVFLFTVALFTQKETSNGHEFILGEGNNHVVVKRSNVRERRGRRGYVMFLVTGRHRCMIVR